MKTCRGCAGTGIGQHVSPRTIAILETIDYTWTLVPKERGSRRFPRRIILPPGTRHPSDIAVKGRFATNPVPLARALREVDRLLADGFRYDDPAGFELDPAWKCSWCHGIGTPQLSVGTMQAVLT